MTACPQPDCAGTIEASGYCGDCGVKPAPAAPASPAGGPAGSSPASERLSVPVPRSRRASGDSRPSAATSAGGRLGLGLVEIPPAPVPDPLSVVLERPEVEERRRFCSTCNGPVGRGRNGQPDRTEGFCPKDGTRYSFTPKLQRGDMVGGQYEVAGCLAHGGLGWIYLARDHQLGKRWVVLKGLLDSGDAAALQAAIAERRFLAEVKHPGIVSVYNFVEHRDQSTQSTAGYIVMEYVGGQSLKQLVLEKRKGGGSLPLAEALCYAIDVLPALGYLHGQGLVYNDFKPDNVILSEDRVRLIDMGAVHRLGADVDSYFSTAGYQAPEISPEGTGPSPAADLYTVARTLAVLTFEFTGFTREFAHRLPDPAQVPLLARQESFYRLLRRATDPDPAKRFTTAAEMTQQLTGVVREVLAQADGTARPALSTLFTPELQAIGAAPGDPDRPDPQQAGPQQARVTAADIVAGLPVPLADGADPAAGYLATLSTLDVARQAEELADVAAGGPGTPPGFADSVEVHLALTRARIMTGRLDEAAASLAGLIDHEGADWRVMWCQGLRDLAAGSPDRARAAFEAVYDELPGERASRLAVALAAEAAGDAAAAARHFEAVWTTDHGYASSAFGLARVRLAAGDRAGAIEVLAAVPESSSHHVPAQVIAFWARIGGRPASELAQADLTEAAQQLGRLRLHAAGRHVLSAELLRAALDWVMAGNTADVQLLGHDLTERSLRFGLEQAYRALARLAPAQDRRVALVDLANDVRPRTRF